MKAKGWHNRGYLPHFDGGETTQFITFRLHDSLPQEVEKRWQLELEGEKELEREAQLRRKVEIYLDQGYGNCYLRDASIASIVQDALLFFDGERYKLLAWVIMPNHIHFLATPLPEQSLSKIVQSIKVYTAKEANKLLSGHGTFWQTDYFDRYIRNIDHFAKTLAYIENNPVKAKLCHSKQDWPFSSAFQNKNVS